MSSHSFQNLFRTLIFGNSITVRNLLEFSKKIFSEFFFLSCHSSFAFELKKCMCPYTIRQFNFESLRLKWKETMYSSLSCVYPFDPFQTFFQSIITSILLNPYISIHLLFISIHPFCLVFSGFGPLYVFGSCCKLHT